MIPSVFEEVDSVEFEANLTDITLPVAAKEYTTSPRFKVTLSAFDTCATKISSDVFHEAEFELTVVYVDSQLAVKSLTPVSIAVESAREDKDTVLLFTMDRFFVPSSKLKVGVIDELSKLPVNGLKEYAIIKISSRWIVGHR